jgi:hypothetical protein
MTDHLTVTIDYDQDCEYPENGWKLHSFTPRRTDFRDPIELGLGPLGENGLPTIPNPGLQKKMKAGLAFICSYFEHGDHIWFLLGEGQHLPDFRWDGVRIAGLLVWKQPAKNLGPKTYEARMADARGYLETITAYENGSCYYYSIEGDDEDVVDSCGGFIGEGGIKSMAEMIRDALQGRPCVFRGPLHDLLVNAMPRDYFYPTQSSMMPF